MTDLLATTNPPTAGLYSSLLPINVVARRLGVIDDALIPYGRYMAKIDIDSIDRTKPQGKLILVSSITPTPLGEGKTVTTIGLSQGINRLGACCVACIRQPSLGPVFGVKGGAAGGGAAQVLPMEKLNLHLTGDIHAISAAHNLAAAALDARIYHEQRLGAAFCQQTDLPLLHIDPQRILWPRVLDHNDRALRQIIVAIGGGSNGVERHDHVEITAASELMAILALTEGLQDMRRRIGRIILAYSTKGNPITADDLGVAGAMTALMKDSIHPTLMQTSEQTPVLIHAGPFANIAHGNSSVLADRLGLQLADYVVTEAGFGSDMGMEKFFNIKYRQSGIAPSCVVLVATLRSLKANSGAFDIKPGQPLPPEITASNVSLLAQGCANLKWHIDNAMSYGLPVVIAINHFPDDSAEELAFLQDFALSAGARACEVSDAFATGGAGTEQLARSVLAACEENTQQPQLLYPDQLPLEEKLQHLAVRYGAKHIEFSPLARQQLAEITAAGFSHLPLCLAKTPLSISADPAKKNVPHDFTLPITSCAVSAGAGFVRIYAGNIMTMPGLGSLPAYHHIDIDDEGHIYGLS
ncbi:formate--tetrahydrofolate ligase [Yersinia ruckeri]|uniref:formate--tetrahydrofolate ligase n=1 Tax=Yersinia ruckeri TaxID=29486 RepID=UPI0004E43505|nr:formate--tetrahydrofolate ligase [Yersinia ruckeri]ARZ01046.1 formate--tetrahydrofolate ligase [Yersinia ruckeri]KFE39147.1 formate--tetrahydrofolate ligase [Yersinia ruckeri]OIX36775.1 formate--tetrahydrofolate ligase [Yersinia ruckeri]OIX37146.1 formate--tetrahydrofolate ligase [Yersinia ruckeri]OIX37599.1 formate--tetrahydrofolate ligase [Yersinia ruckeri]